MLKNGDDRKFIAQRRQPYFEVIAQFVARCTPASEKVLFVEDEMPEGRQQPGYYRLGLQAIKPFTDCRSDISERQWQLLRGKPRPLAFLKATIFTRCPSNWRPNPYETQTQPDACASQNRSQLHQNWNPASLLQDPKN